MASTPRPHHRPLGIALACAALVAGLAAAPAAADQPEPPSADEPAADTLPSFSESPGCGALDGVRGPLVAEPGHIPDGTPYYGPWADFYGRSKDLVMGQFVEVRLPNMTYDKALYVHERVLPAFEAMLDNLADAAEGGLTYTVNSGQTWSLSFRTIGSGRAMSFHSVGAAIDVNSLLNPYRDDNVLITDMPEWFVDAWRDAGWCWGGDWQTIKDPMHMSWMGPIHTPGYVTPPPQDPVVGAAGFTDEIGLGVLLPGDEDGRPELVADIDRDGAADVVRVEPVAGSEQYVLRVAVARHSHETCEVTPTAVSPTDPGAPVFLEDVTGDARADLVYALDGGGTLALEVFPMVQNAALVPETRTTAVAPAPGDQYLFADHDRDGATDLYVVRDGDPARLEIWRGPAFTDRIVDVDLGVASAGYRFALGDVALDGHFDGIPDVYALDGGGVLTIHPASLGFAPQDPVATGGAGAERLTLQDLDGDGHDDLLLTDGDGATRMLRGGLSTHDPGVWYELPEHEWVPGAGCATPPPMCAGYVATLVGTDGDDVLYGNDLDNVILAGNGDDTVFALGGDDRVCAGKGRDTVFGGDGRDRLYGQQGADTLKGGNDRDVLKGAGGSDVLVGNGGADKLLGGTRDDVLIGKGGRDRLVGGTGSDEADGGGNAYDRCDAEVEVDCERAA